MRERFRKKRESKNKRSYCKNKNIINLKENKNPTHAHHIILQGLSRGQAWYLLLPFRFIIYHSSEMTCHVLALKLVFIKCFPYHGTGLCGYKVKGNVQWVAINIPDKIIVLIHDLSFTQNTCSHKKQAYVANCSTDYQKTLNRNKLK